MTKLEELARQLRDMAVDYEHEDSDRNKMQHEMLVAIETALKPLLDAFQTVYDLARTNQEHWEDEDWTILHDNGEQLSQWRKK